jgi:hypothetical protein
MLSFLLGVLRFFPVLVFLFVVAFAFCDGLASALVSLAYSLEVYLY